MEMKSKFENKKAESALRLFDRKPHLSLFNDIPPQEPPLQPIPIQFTSNANNRNMVC